MFTKDILNIVASLASFFLVYYVSGKLTSGKKFSFLMERSGRYGSIDGLRGYLALSVFIHHFIITWHWKNEGLWKRPPEDYFQNYGRVGVAIFFMITGFLFISKILKDQGETNWIKLFESRVFRIFPLYLFALFIITSTVFFNTNFELYVEIPEIIKQYIRWFIFFGTEINGFAETKHIIASVDWTLRYEWLFYLSLPLIALIISYGKIASILLLSVCFLAYKFPVSHIGISSIYFILFAVGGICAYITKHQLFNKIDFEGRIVSLVSILLLLFILIYPYTFDPIHIISISLFFFLVSQGGDMFGLFRKKPSILLGEISYSIYLLHGIVLYFVFSQFSIISLEQLPLDRYLLLMPLLAVLVVLISMFTYSSIELPSMNFGRNYFFTRKIEALLSKNSSE